MIVKRREALCLEVEAESAHLEPQAESRESK